VHESKLNRGPRPSATVTTWVNWGTATLLKKARSSADRPLENGCPARGKRPGIPGSTCASLAVVQSNSSAAARLRTIVRLRLNVLDPLSLTYPVPIHAMTRQNCRRHDASRQWGFVLRPGSIFDRLWQTHETRNHGSPPLDSVHAFSALLLPPRPIERLRYAHRSDLFRFVHRPIRFWRRTSPGSRSHRFPFRVK
jgi:hypothetical protein